MTRLSLVIVMLLAAPRAGFASCEAAGPTFHETALSPCTAVFVGRVIGYRPLSKPEYVPIGLDVVVREVLKGSVPRRRLTLWGGGPFGRTPSPTSFPMGSDWLFVLMARDDLEPPFEYVLGGGECGGDYFGPLANPSAARELRAEMATSNSRGLSKLHSECAAGRSTACYSAGCVHETGLGVARDLRKAAALFRRGLELEQGYPDFFATPVPGSE